VVRSTRKRVKAQVFRGFKSHLHRHSPAPTPALTDGSRVPQAPVVSFIGLSYARRAVRPPGSAAAVVPGHRGPGTGLNAGERRCARRPSLWPLEFGAGGTVRDRPDALRLTDCITLSDWDGSTRTRRAT